MVGKGWAVSLPPFKKQMSLTIINIPFSLTLLQCEGLRESLTLEVHFPYFLANFHPRIPGVYADK